MPNHVDCKIRVHGRPQKIKDFLLAVNGGPETPIDANLIIPYPKKYARQDAKAAAHNKKVQKTGKGKWMKDGYNSGGYQWCIDNWGTKWGMYDFSSITHYQKSMLVQCFTAWSPPTPLIQKLGELFPDLKFTLRYYEGGSGFKGVYQVKGKKVLQDQSEDYRGSKGG
jgi:hypothetical protein